MDTQDWVQISTYRDVKGAPTYRAALRPLGLHPDQPTSRPTGVSPPAWWHAAAWLVAAPPRW